MSAPVPTVHVRCTNCYPPVDTVLDAHNRLWALSAEQVRGLLAYDRWARLHLADALAADERGTAPQRQPLAA